MVSEAREEKVAAEINLAQLILHKHKLIPPIDIEKLLSEYADISYEDIPADIEGITLDLKNPSIRPSVIINSRKNNYRRRTRFTLAHELGHIVIPWHTGTIVDVVKTPDVLSRLDDPYWAMEAEANQFASELLLPTDWLKEQSEQFDNAADFTEYAADHTEVSFQVAAFKTIRVLKPNWVVARLNNHGVCEWSERSSGTLASRVVQGTFIEPSDTFPESRQYQKQAGDASYIWWRIANEVKLPEPLDDRTSAEIFKAICDDVGTPITKSLIQSVSGIIGYSNGSVRGPGRNPERVYAAAIQRFNANTLLRPLIEHRDFKHFLVKRISGFKF